MFRLFRFHWLRIYCSSSLANEAGLWKTGQKTIEKRLYNVDTCRVGLARYTDLAREIGSAYRGTVPEDCPAYTLHCGSKIEFLLHF